MKRRDLISNLFLAQDALMGRQTSQYSLCISLTQFNFYMVNSTFYRVNLFFLWLARVFTW